MSSSTKSTPEKNTFQDEAIAAMYKSIENSALPYRVPTEQELIAMHQIGI
jgi:hypothetical protein